MKKKTYSFNYEVISLKCNQKKVFLNIEINDNANIFSLKFCDHVINKKEAFPAQIEFVRELCNFQLTEYFQKKRDCFTIPIQLDGTKFQMKVWDSLSRIPYGKTQSYKYIAEHIKMDKAFQAVGTAIGKNPIPIIIPCHRVIKSNGDLGHYSGGAEIKKFLLAHELISDGNSF